MKKYFGISLALICMYVSAESFKQIFKKLDNKKYQVILNTTKYLVVERSLISVARSTYVN